MKPTRIEKTISIEGAKIGFRNFSGKEGKFNPAGRRNFCVFLEDDLAKTLEADGWNVRWLQPKDEGDPIQGYMQVAVDFRNIPPRVFMITGAAKNQLDEESVSVLDWAEIENVDLIIRPYNWIIAPGTKNEKVGIKAYVKSMYVTIAQDDFEKKYYNIPTEGVNEIEDGD